MGYSECKIRSQRSNLSLADNTEIEYMMIHRTNTKLQSKMEYIIFLKSDDSSSEKLMHNKAYLLLIYKNFIRKSVILLYFQ
jgi:hypothetical protein